MKKSIIWILSFAVLTAFAGGKDVSGDNITTNTLIGNVNSAVTTVGDINALKVETDPTVPAWAKENEKPRYSAGEVGARPNDWMPNAQDVGALPVGEETLKTTPAFSNAVIATVAPVIPKKASDVGARPNSWTPTAADVGARPSDWMPTAEDVGALSQLDADGRYLRNKHVDGYNWLRWGPEGQFFVESSDTAIEVTAGGDWSEVTMTSNDKNGKKTYFSSYLSEGGSNYIAYPSFRYFRFGEFDRNWNFPAKGGTFALTDDIPTDEHITDLAAAAASTKADAATVAALAQNVEVWTGVWKGDNSRVVITNYDSQVHLPEFSFEQRTNEVDMATNLFRVVWREMAHWESFLGLGWDWEDPNWQGFGAWKSATEQAIAGKADRAWGYYDSHSGNYAPDGYTWISSPEIAIAGGLAYNKVLTTEGAVWVLESNGLVTETGGTASNGFFRISDDAGNSLFEIVKGDKRTVGATAGTVQTLTGFQITHLQVGYNVESAEHPKIYVTDSLKPANWKAEDDPDCVADVVWSGSSGAWIATVSGKVAKPVFFVQASYEVGGNTYIKQSAPVQMSKMVLGGVEYTLGTTTINGSKVLTLTP